MVAAIDKAGARDSSTGCRKNTSDPRHRLRGRRAAVGRSVAARSRAFYQSAPVLIMDEPTSAIDAEAELEI
jgi:ABC-type transport system involved in cytochrome bd biosynthesis fused ATPase/permease subunit